MPTMKKPAADKGKGMYNTVKRPAAAALPVDREKKAKHGEEEPEESEAESQVQPPSLTEEALRNHQRFLKEMSKFKDMSQDGFEKALEKLPTSTREHLWKAFEASRKETGTEKEYKDACSGAGALRKKKALLRGWVLDKGTIGQCYRQSITTISMNYKEGLEESWFTKQEALQKWGPEELKERLKKGTIEARRNPLDKTYFEFKSVVHKKSKMAERNKVASYGTNQLKARQMSWLLLTCSGNGCLHGWIANIPIVMAAVFNCSGSLCNHCMHGWMTKSKCHGCLHGHVSWTQMFWQFLEWLLLWLDSQHAA